MGMTAQCHSSSVADRMSSYLTMQFAVCANQQHADLVLSRILMSQYYVLVNLSHTVVECVFLFVIQLPLTLQERVRGQLTRREILELEDDGGDPAADSTRPVNIPIPTFPPTAAVCAVPTASHSTNGSLLHRVNTVPTSLLAQALLPPEDEQLPRRRRGDTYVCSICRRCDSAIDGGSQPATLHVTNEEHSFQTSAGVHHARKSPTLPNFTLTRS